MNDKDSHEGGKTMDKSMKKVVGGLGIMFMGAYMMRWGIGGTVGSLGIFWGFWMFIDGMF